MGEEKLCDHKIKYETKIPFEKMHRKSERF